MKATWLIPPTMNIETMVNSLKCDKEIRFLNQDLNIDTIKADVIIYVGATAPPYYIPIEILKALKDKAKLINICCDADSEGWHPLLEQYAKEDVFDLSINLSGSHNWPSRPQDLTMVALIDADPYKSEESPKVILDKKSVWLGFTGGITPGGPRDSLLKELGDDVVIGQRIETYGQHQQYVDFIKSCRCTLNIPFSSSGLSTRVNGKILEAAYARSVVIERAGSECDNWFLSGAEYLPYETAEDIRNHIKMLQAHPERIMGITNRMYNKVSQLYSADKSWELIFKKVGFLWQSGHCQTI